MIMIPNGAYLGASLKGRQVTMARLQREGFRSGVTDYVLPVPIPYSALEQPKAGLWLELKRQGATNSDVRVEQAVFLADMVQLGYEARWARGAEHAEIIVRQYLLATMHSVSVGYTADIGGPFAKAFYARREVAGMARL